MRYLMKTKNLVLVSLFVAVTAVFSQLSVPNPFSPVPISLSVAAVYLCGVLLEARYAFLAQLIYILLGAVGLPVFAQFSGGLGVLAGPTGGYILAYPFIALLVALFTHKKWIRSDTVALLAGMFLALLVCYAFGSAWLAVVMKVSFFKALLLGAAPFVIVDILKIAACLVLARALKRALKGYKQEKVQ